MDSKKLLVFSTLALSLVLFGVATTHELLKKPAPLIVVRKGSLALGKATAPIEIVLIEDLQCKKCRAFNGLFYDPESQKVIDYVDGYPDIAKRVLRAIGQPDVRFTQDPVRMIRLIKFCARFNFDIHPPTFEALLHCKREILKSSSARIFEELLRMLESGASRPFFHLINEYGLLKPLSPALSSYLEKSDNLSLSLLSVVDDEIKKNLPQPLDRSLLLSTLIFPLFADHLEERGKHSDRPLHLGQIAEAAHRVIDQVFNPFFNIPRRMRGIMASILAAQYRLVPLDGRPLKRPRAPRDPLFPLALRLLSFRASLQPELLPHYTLWTEAAFAAHEAGEIPPLEEGAPPRRRRRRRRRGRGKPL